jgi:predicted dienelactone hydrolase
MIVFALLLLSSAVLAFRRDRRGKVAFLAGSLAALLVAAFAAWSLRWQIVPALLVSALSAGAGWWMLGRNVQRRGRIAVAIVVFTLLSAVPYGFFPVFTLPPPDGPFLVGVRTTDLRDASRRGVLFTKPEAPRDVPITIWYPASAGATGHVRPYLTRREALDEAVSVAKLWGFPAYRFLSLHSVGTHAIENAPVAEGQEFPLVIFSHGYWSFRAQNTALMERLASHGYIVVSVAHPRDSADVRLQDGTLIPFAPHIGPDERWDEATAAFMGGENHERRIAALTEYKAAVAAHRLGQSLEAWRDDVLFVSKALRGNPANVGGVMAAADFSRIVHAGMSFGGSTAVSACDSDPDCVAAVDLDGENFDGDQFDRAVRAPLLLMLTDQPFSAHQRTVAFNPTDYAWERWHCIGEREDIVRLRARGILHMGLTDFVLSARGPFKSGHFTGLDGERALSLVNDTVLAFLQQHVRGSGAGVAGVLRKYPELQRLDTSALRIYAQGLPDRTPCSAQARTYR